MKETTRSTWKLTTINSEMTLGSPIACSSQTAAGAGAERDARQRRLRRRAVSARREVSISELASTAFCTCLARQYKARLCAATNRQGTCSQPYPRRANLRHRCPESGLPPITFLGVSGGGPMRLRLCAALLELQLYPGFFHLIAVTRTVDPDLREEFAVPDLVEHQSGRNSGGSRIWLRAWLDGQGSCKLWFELL